MTGGRFERKFLVGELLLAEVESLVRLHPAHFDSPFPPRFVNNIYLDSLGLSNYFENADGVAQRQKLRIRWYGDAFGRVERPVLEVKAKAGLLGTKDSHRLPEFEMTPGLGAEDIRAILDELPEPVRTDALAQEPILVNRYRRSYHVSGDGRFRLTIDSELQFRPFDRIASSFAHVFEERDAIVVELKYDQDLDREAERIASAFPFRLTKSSKYATGIERLLA